MPNQRLTDKTKVSDNLAIDDKLMVVDTSDTSSSALGTSKYLTPEYINVTVKVSIDNTAFLGLVSSGFTLVGGQGAGHILVPISVMIKHTPGASPNTSGMRLKVGYINGDSSYYWSETRFWPDSPSYVGQWLEMNANPGSIRGLSSGTLENQPLYLYGTGSVSPGATDTLEVWTTYKKLNVI